MSETVSTPGGLPEQPRVRQIRVVDAGMRDPGATGGILGVIRNPYLLRLVVEREIRGRYAGSFMGLIWSYVNPLVQFVIYWFVMGEVMGAHKNIPNYPIHVFAGFVITHFFGETFVAGTHSIVNNKSLVQKLPMPKELFPIAAMLTSLYQVLPAMVILLIADFVTGWRPDAATFVGFGLALLIIAFLGTAIALVFSAANVYFHDFSSVVSIINHFVRFGVPMVYGFSQLNEKYGGFAHVLSYNPLFSSVLLMDRAFWVKSVHDATKTTVIDGHTHNKELHGEAAQHFVRMTEFPAHFWASAVAALGISIVLLFLAQIAFTKLEVRIPERL